MAIVGRKTVSIRREKDKETGRVGERGSRRVREHEVEGRAQERRIGEGANRAGRKYP